VKNQWFLNIIDSIADRGRELLGLDNDAVHKKDIQGLCRQLLEGHGEASGIALSQEILRIYGAMDTGARLDFFSLLAGAFDPDMAQIEASMSRYRASRSADDLFALNAAVEAPRQELFRRLNMAPNGTAGLVALRADLLGFLAEHPQLKSVDADMKHLFSSWFNRGFLQLHNIDWKSPAHILEKLINYESVHEIRGWDDLRRRLMKDRRCFAFFHPAMAEEPLIFIEVALVQGLSGEVGNLIDPQAPELDPLQADTAIFYSINNTQTGLRGISFGNFLIKQVLIELTRECPWIKISSTLSPIPSLTPAVRRWLKGENNQPHDALFDDILQQHTPALKSLAEQQAVDAARSPRETLAALLENTHNLADDHIDSLLSDLALAYLVTPNNNGKLPDPVAMFHLSNGARLERLNTRADMSANGIASSFGMMVNYRYDLKDVETNHEAFVTQGRVMMSDSLKKRLK
jgi:malonyl-CoA decarboxylase